MNALKQVATGAIKIAGDINFANVVSLRNEGQQFIEESTELVFDFADVNKVDSSALALLTAWWRYAKLHHKSIVFANVPATLVDLAKLSNLEHVLPLSADGRISTQA